MALNPAVSVRNTRGPQVTVCTPACTALVSSSSLNPPSGPMNNVHFCVGTETLAMLLLPEGWSSNPVVAARLKHEERLAGASIVGSLLLPHCVQALIATLCQCVIFFCCRLVSICITDRSAIAGIIRHTPNSVAFCITRSSFVPLASDCTRVIASGDSELFSCFSVIVTLTCLPASFNTVK